MKKLFYILLGILTLCTVQSCQDNRKARNYNAKTQVDAQALTFIKTGIESGLTEIKTARVAETHSQNPRIISFAKMMITDHTQAGKELKKIESDEYVTDYDKISPDHQKMIADISAKSGTEFDKAYMQMMVTDHEAAVKLFTMASEDKSETIQDFARKTLPKIKMHLDSAKAICAGLK